MSKKIMYHFSILIGCPPIKSVVKVLRYKSEGRWFDPRCVMEYLIDINPSDHTMALGSTQPLTEMSTRCISWG
jgi:hypothetical protein